MAGIRMTGMTSGLDTESIVQAMVMGYTKKKEKLEKSQTKLEWSQEIWKNTNSKVYSLYTGLDKVRFSGNVKAKKTSISDNTKATISAGSGAVDGTQTLRITKMAKAGYLTGAKLEGQNGNTVTKDTKLTSLGVEEGSSFDIKVGSKTTTINIDEDTSVKDVVTQLQEAGVNASFDEKNGRFFIGAKSSGADNDFTLSGNGSNGTAALKSLGLLAKTDEDIAALNKTKNLGTFKSDGTLDEEATKNSIKEQFNALKEKYNTALDTQISLIDDKASLEEQSASDRTYLDNRKEVQKYLTAKQSVLAKGDDASDEDKALVSSLEKQLQDDPDSMDKDLRFYVNSAKDRTNVDSLVNYNAGIVATAQEKVDAWDAQIKDVDDQIAKQVEIKQGIVDEMKDNELLADFTDTIATADADTVASAGLAKIKAAISDLEAEDSDGATRINGQDAEIYLNGAKFTSDTNTFEINGLTINATGVTGDDEITITTSTDVDAIYDKYKDFLDQYNNVINELQKLYNADSAKDYEPLTEDEKAEMSDTEIEKWESKIKDSLLRRDTTLRGVISSMTTSMGQSYEIQMKDGSTQRMAFSSVGVHTLGFLNAATNEQYAYHIDGDEDDDKTSSNSEKLRAFIESDPDAAVSLLSQVAQGLYKALDSKVGMTTTENSSAFTMYNDKQMTRDLSTYKTKIKEWETRIEDQEDYYYKKFSAMEKALTNLNSSQSALGGLLGG